MHAGARHPRRMAPRSWAALGASAVPPEKRAMLAAMA